MSLSIDTESRKDNVTRIALDGRLDSNTTPQLEAVLIGVLAGGAVSVVYDLADLTYISSAGLRAIFRTSRELKKGGGGIAVVNLQPQVKKVFDHGRRVECQAYRGSRHLCGVRLYYG